MSSFSVIGVTRRKARLIDPSGIESEAQLRSNADEVVCGDMVTVDSSSGTPVITSIEERKNLLSRSYGTRTKLLAANLDHLFIVTAVCPLFNTVFIDRTIAACSFEGIPFSLIVNKTDKGLSETESLIEIYQKLALPILFTSTKSTDGTLPLIDRLNNPAVTRVALCGISGVGKSSLLQRLVPEAEIKTSSVSEKTGQGRQTTTMAVTYTRTKSDNTTQQVIDLPGLQHFGVSHIPLSQLRDHFVEFVPLGMECQFIDCAHVSEPSCKVRDALVHGEISESRYNSYLHMRKEIESGKQY